MEEEAGSILISGGASILIFGGVATGMSDRPDVRLRLRAGIGGLDGVSAKSKAARASRVGDSLRALNRFDGVATRSDGVLNGVRPLFMGGLVG